MIANPFVRLYEAPVETLTASAYAVFLAALLVATWWALSRNALYLHEEWQNGWLVLIPGAYAARVVLTAVIVAVDLLLLAGIVHVVT